MPTPDNVAVAGDAHRAARVPPFKSRIGEQAIKADRLGCASAPLYAFAGSFLIRSYGFTSSQAGLAFGMLQGALGLIGTLVAGRWFDHVLKAKGGLLIRPAMLFILAGSTTTAALFAPTGTIALILLAPVMFAFPFALPWGFGAAHLAAGEGNQALASSLVMIGASLLGPALGPLFVGMMSDAAAASGIGNGLPYALLLIPLCCFITAGLYMAANRSLRPIVAAHGGRSDGSPSQ